MDEAKLQASIMLHEGFRSKPYTDSAGCLTIGYGRNLSDVGISEPEGRFLLGNNIQSCIAQAAAQPWWQAVAGDDVRSRAILEILFNLGLAKLGQFVVALSALGASDFEGAAAAFRDSNWFRQVGSQPGQRGYMLTEMIRTGNDPAQ